MLTCKQVSRALHGSDYAKLPLLSRLALRLHVALCFVCGRYHRDIMVFQDGVRGFLRQEESDQGPLAEQARLPPATRERIKRALHAERPA
jgi:hypothetical protein